MSVQSMKENQRMEHPSQLLQLKSVGDWILNLDLASQNLPPLLCSVCSEKPTLSDPSFLFNFFFIVVKTHNIKHTTLPYELYSSVPLSMFTLFCNFLHFPNFSPS